MAGVSKRESRRRVGRRRGAAGVGATILLVLVVSATPSAAQEQDRASVSGTTITLTLVSPNGQPAYAFGVELPPELAGNVVSISGPPGSTANLTGGPDGAPEVLFDPPVTSATITITGRAPWPPTVTLTPFVSTDNQTYSTGTPITATSTPEPVPGTTTTTTVTTPPTTHPPDGTSESSSGTNLDWLWGTLLGVGLLTAGVGFVYLLRFGRDKGPCKELIDACEWARKVAEKRAEELRLDRRIAEIRAEERTKCAARIKDLEAELEQRQRRLAAATAVAQQYPPGPGDAAYQTQAKRAAEDVEFCKGQVESAGQSITMLRESLARYDDLIASHARDVAISQAQWEAANADMETKCKAAADCIGATETSLQVQELFAATSIGGDTVGAGALGGDTYDGGLTLVGTTSRGPCGCDCTATIVGSSTFAMGDDDITWELRKDAADSLTEIVLVGQSPDNHKVEARYDVDLRVVCGGNGQAGDWQVAWAILEHAADHLLIQVTVTGTTTCADQSRMVQCTGTLRITLTSHCGPEITDQYIVALNRIIDRLREREDATWHADSDDNTLVQYIDVGGDLVETMAFLTAAGPWITFRPFEQDFAHDGKPHWEPGLCPSCQRCGATVTMLGKCIDSYATDALMYGLVAGFLEVSIETMDTGGLIAKWLNHHHLNPETYDGAMPAWHTGHAMGTNARNNPDYHVTRSDRWLREAVNQAIERSDCDPCSESVPIDGVDFSSMEWNLKNMLTKHEQKYPYKPPPPPTKTPPR